jgi:hypothetical protein
MGIALLGFGGALLLGTGWLAFTRLGGSPSSAAEAFTPSNRMDEAALIAAHAERPGETAAAAPPAAEANVVEASAEGKPGAGEAPALGPAEPGESRFNPREIADESRGAADAAEAQADKLEAQVEAAVDEAEEEFRE